MFEINIPEQNERTIEDILNHLKFSEAVAVKLPYDHKFMLEAIEIVVAYINNKIFYKNAYDNILELAEGKGMQSISIASIIMDLNEAMEIKTKKKKN